MIFIGNIDLITYFRDTALFKLIFDFWIKVEKKFFEDIFQMFYFHLVFYITFLVIFFIKFIFLLHTWIILCSSICIMFFNLLLFVSCFVFFNLLLFGSCFVFCVVFASFSGSCLQRDCQRDLTLTTRHLHRKKKRNSKYKNKKV